MTMRMLAVTLAALFCATGYATSPRGLVAAGGASAADARTAQAARPRGIGSLRGRVDIRRTAPPEQRRPTVTELGTPAPRPTPEARRAVVYLESGPIGAFEEDERP